MLTLWLQVQVQVWFSIPVIVLFRCLSLIPGFMSDPEFYVSSYYLGLFIHVGMGRLGDRWQVLILVAHADDDEDEQEAFAYYFILCTGCSAVYTLSAL